MSDGFQGLVHYINTPFMCLLRTENLIYQHPEKKQNKSVKLTFPIFNHDFRTVLGYRSFRISSYQRCSYWKVCQSSKDTGKNLLLFCHNITVKHNLWRSVFEYNLLFVQKTRGRNNGRSSLWRRDFRVFSAYSAENTQKSLSSTVMTGRYFDP